MKGKIVFRRRLNDAGEFDDVPMYFIGTREVTAEEFEAAFPTAEEITHIPGGTPRSGWPMASLAMGVLPHLVERAAEKDRQLGVPTEYTRGGRPIFRDRAHRRAFLKAHGKHDQDGGYGDG